MWQAGPPGDQWLEEKFFGAFIGLLIIAPILPPATCRQEKAWLLCGTQ